jgi:hypothetical protein
LALWRRLAGKAGGTTRAFMWSSLDDIFDDDKVVAVAAEHWKAEEDEWWWEVLYDANEDVDDEEKTLGELVAIVTSLRRSWDDSHLDSDWLCY